MGILSFLAEKQPNYQAVVVLLNHDIDRKTLYRGGGYIIEDDNMLKPCATHFPQPGALLVPSPYTTIKISKMT